MLVAVISGEMSVQLGLTSVALRWTRYFFPTTLAQVRVNSPFAGTAALLTLKAEALESGLVPAACSASFVWPSASSSAASSGPQVRKTASGSGGAASASSAGSHRR